MRLCSAPSLCQQLSAVLRSPTSPAASPLPCKFVCPRLNAAVADVRCPSLTIANEVEGQTGPTADPIIIKQEDDTANTLQKPKTIDVQLKGADGYSVWYKMKLDTKMEKVLNHYAMRTGIERHGMRFLLEGQLVYDTSTPLSVSRSPSCNQPTSLTIVASHGDG